MGGRRDTQEEFESKVYNLVGNEYTVVGVYVNTKTKILMKHNVCNRERLIKPHSFLHLGHRCLLCENERRKIAYKGKNNPNYKNGTSGLSSYLRHYISEWKLNILKIYDYKCSFTNQNNGDLQIHHFYNYSTIISDVLKELQLESKIDINLYTEHELKNIEKLFVNKHTEDMGVCLSKPIHDLFHRLYGRKNNSKIQFEEFKQRYINGELNDELKNMKIIRKLKKKEVKEIRKMLINNTKVLDIAKKFEVSNSTISNIKNNKTYKNIV